MRLVAGLMVLAIDLFERAALSSTANHPFG
jgi:hypothetical protein